MAQISKMKSNFDFFDHVRPEKVCKTGRTPHLIPDTREVYSQQYYERLLTLIKQGILDFLIEYSTTYIDEIITFINEEYDTQTSRETIRKAAPNTRSLSCAISPLPYSSDSKHIKTIYRANWRYI